MITWIRTLLYADSCGPQSWEMSSWRTTDQKVERVNCLRRLSVLHDVHLLAGLVFWHHRNEPGVDQKWYHKKGSSIEKLKVDNILSFSPALATEALEWFRLGSPEPKYVMILVNTGISQPQTWSTPWTVRSLSRQLQQKWQQNVPKNMCIVEPFMKNRSTTGRSINFNRTSHNEVYIKIVSIKILLYITEFLIQQCHESTKKPRVKGQIANKSLLWKWVSIGSVAWFSEPSTTHHPFNDLSRLLFFLNRVLNSIII